MFLGLDGFSSGWVAIWLDERCRTEINFLPENFDFDKLFAQPFKRAMIDIPIGLPDSGYRVCDSEAREMLGAGRSRVFLGARRPLLSYKTREAAHAWGKRTDGKGVSCQLFCILPKIQYIDAAMTPSRQQRMMESHPELVFHHLNGGSLLPNKKSSRGIQLRREILLKKGLKSIDALLDKRIGMGPKPDDILDACACAVAAKDATTARRLPETAQSPDSRGLRMEIWF